MVTLGMSPGAALPVVCSCVRYAWAYIVPPAVELAVPGVTYGVVLLAKVAAVPTVDAAASPDAATAGVVPAAALMTLATTDVPVDGAADDTL